MTSTLGSKDRVHGYTSLPERQRMLQADLIGLAKARSNARTAGLPNICLANPLVFASYSFVKLSKLL